MKKNAKKRIALTLAAVSAIGIGAATMSKAQETNAMMRIFGGIRNILTGRSTSTGTSYIGTPKTVSLVNNSAFSNNTKTHKDGSKTTTSRGLTGSKGAINSGAVTSNGTPFQGMPKNQTQIDNSAFNTGSGVKKHAAPQTQMKTVEKQIATSSKDTKTLKAIKVDVNPVYTSSGSTTTQDGKTKTSLKLTVSNGQITGQK